jgi:hypothetical protein
VLVTKSALCEPTMRTIEASRLMIPLITINTASTVMATGRRGDSVRKSVESVVAMAVLLQGGR